MIMDDFYASLNEQIKSLEESESFTMDFHVPLNVDHIKALAFRLQRRGRSKLIKKLKINNFNIMGADKEKCIEELEKLVKGMVNLKKFCFEGRNSGDNLTSTDLGRLVFACQYLDSLKIQCLRTQQEYSPDRALLIRHPCQLKTLKIRYVGENEISQFVECLNKLVGLEKLEVATNAAVSERSHNQLLESICGSFNSLRSLSVTSLSESFSLRQLCRILREVELEFLYMSNYGNSRLFSSEGPHDLDELSSVLQGRVSLKCLALLGRVGLDEKLISRIFKSLEHNKIMTSVVLTPISMSINGWKQIMQSVQNNSCLSYVEFLFLDMRQVIFQENVVETIATELKLNTSITSFICRRLNDSMDDLEILACSASHDKLRALAERNKSIKLAKKTLPGVSFPEALLPWVLARLANNEGECSAQFTAVKNFSGHLSTCGRRSQKRNSNKRRPPPLKTRSALTTKRVLRPRRGNH